MTKLEKQLTEVVIIYREIVKQYEETIELYKTQVNSLQLQNAMLKEHAEKLGRRTALM